ncbi:MAG: Lrp/AsnC ligand binding domain-containing protein [Nanoarchaeota archaeon]|nr:Lrp/AsnC ligand binding domain-containing protein [Nanoarchaeota archaeon]
MEANSTLGALIYIKVAEGGKVSPLEVASDISKLDSVEEVFLVSGEWPIIIRVTCKDMIELSDFVISKLGAVKGIEKTDTVIIMDKIK